MNKENLQNKDILTICDNLSSKNGELYFAGCNVNLLALKYGTPLYLMDENKIRQNIALYQNALKENFGDNATLIYASKANCFSYIYKIMSNTNTKIDVVSIGELYTAINAGYDVSNAYFHSNNKTNKDIEYAIAKGIGYFVCDNLEEVNIIENVCAKNNITQKIFLRVTPGIDVHTYEAVQTGQIDSKFGIAIETGQAMNAVAEILKLKHIDLKGFHCHVGSQVFEEDVYERTIEIMVKFFYDVKNKLNFETKGFDIGGGFGVRYVVSDHYINVNEKITSIAHKLKEQCNKYDLKIPHFIMEPGRSIVADAGITIYTVGSIKQIPGYKNYVSIDGGMTDNPRYALYNSDYSVLVPNKMNDALTFEADLVGRCCESGDIIKPKALFPKTIRRGDYVAVLTTGAYNYSMASNYNRLPRPAIVMIKDGKDFIVVKRESLDDLIKNDVL